MLVGFVGGIWVKEVKELCSSSEHYCYNTCKTVRGVQHFVDGIYAVSDSLVMIFSLLIAVYFWFYAIIGDLRSQFLFIANRLRRIFLGILSGLPRHFCINFLNVNEK